MLPLLLGRYKPGHNNVRLIFRVSAIVEVERILNHNQCPVWAGSCRQSRVCFHAIPRPPLDSYSRCWPNPDTPCQT